MRRLVAEADHRRAKAKAHRVHEPFVAHLAYVEPFGLRGHQTRHRALGRMAIHTEQFREVVARADGDDTELRVAPGLEQTVGDLVHHAVPADGDDAPRTRLGCRAREVGGVTGTLGDQHLGGPALGAKRSRDRVGRAAGSTTSRDWIDDDVSLKHRR